MPIFSIELLGLLAASVKSRLDCKQYIHVLWYPIFGHLFLLYVCMYSAGIKT